MDRASRLVLSKSKGLILACQGDDGGWDGRESSQQAGIAAAPQEGSGASSVQKYSRI